MTSPHKWTQADLQLLRALYADTPNDVIAVQLRCSAIAVKRAADKQGLVKSEAFNEKAKALRRLQTKNAIKKNAAARGWKPREKLPGETPAITFVQSAMNHIPQHQAVRAGGNDFLRIKSIGF